MVSYGTGNTTNVVFPVHMASIHPALWAGGSWFTLAPFTWVYSFA